MYICGLIPRTFAELAEVVPIVLDSGMENHPTGIHNELHFVNETEVSASHCHTGY